MGGVPGPTVVDILAACELAPLPLTALLAAAALYAGGVRRAGRRYPGAAWPAVRRRWFLAGLGVTVVALQSPIAVYAKEFLWVHMVQHLLVTMVAAPLLLLGAPLTLAMRATGSASRRGLLWRASRSLPARILTHPVVAWTIFAGALLGTHFSPLYEASLEQAPIHDLEHVVYLSTALLFWWPVIGLDPGRGRIPHIVKLLYVFAAGPVNTLTALAIYSAGHVLYPHYTEVARTWGPSPAADQRIAGSLMWITGDLALVIAAGLVLRAWMRHDRTEAVRLDARLDAETPRAGRAARPGSVGGMRPPTTCHRNGVQRPG
jgi:putative membrane protein